MKKEKKTESNKKHMSSFTPEINKKSEKIVDKKKRKESANIASKMQREASQENFTTEKPEKALSKSLIIQDGQQRKSLIHASFSANKGEGVNIPALFSQDDNRAFESPLSLEANAGKISDFQNEKLESGQKKGQKKLSEIERKKLQKNINEIEFSGDLKFLLDIVLKKKSHIEKK